MPSKKPTRKPPRKRKPEYKEGDVVLVKWKDAATSSVWGDHEARLVEVMTIGFFRGKQITKLGESFVVSPTVADDGHFADNISIPVECVLDVSVVMEKTVGLK